MKIVLWITFGFVVLGLASYFLGWWDKPKQFKRVFWDDTLGMYVSEKGFRANAYRAYLKNKPWKIG